MNPVIRVEHVSKKFRIGAQQASFPTLRDRLSDAVRAPLERLRRRRDGAQARGEAETVWALRDVSFEVAPGEVIGIIGRNGAGKSTLLKILSRITDPTDGCAELYGRIGSLLEVGTGFHPELTGRENVFLNGAILGMRRADIVRRFDAIVAFSEIERFIDTPVKFYSSGMYVRLAFAVAAHLEPEIMVIDEVLSVGDMAFQQKCLDKIAGMRAQTKAIILVSHNMISVRAICSRAMLLDGGVIAADGDPEEVVPLYEKLMLESLREAGDEMETGLGHVRVESVALVGDDGEERRSFEVGERVRVLVEYDAVERSEGVVVYAGVRRPDGFICVATSTKLEGIELPPLEGRGRVEVEIPEMLVLPGHYVMDVTFYDRNFEFRTYFLGRKRVEFEVTSSRLPLDEKYGVFYQKQNWRVRPD
jgi:lipopolysaccharide transport system ATP-binding protein